MASEIACWDLLPGMTFKPRRQKQRWKLIRLAEEHDHPDYPKEKLLNKMRSKWIAAPVAKPLEQHLVCFDVLMRPADLKWRSS